MQFLFLLHISYNFFTVFCIPVPFISHLYSHSIIPPYHFNALSLYALSAASPNTTKSIHPEAALLIVTGLPTIIFRPGTPLFIIYFTDVPVKYPPEFIKSKL